MNLLCLLLAFTTITTALIIPTAPVIVAPVIDIPSDPVVPVKDNIPQETSTSDPPEAETKTPAPVMNTPQQTSSDPPEAETKTRAPVMNNIPQQASSDAPMASDRTHKTSAPVIVTPSTAPVTFKPISVVVKDRISSKTLSSDVVEVSDPVLIHPEPSAGPIQVKAESPALVLKPDDGKDDEDTSEKESSAIVSYIISIGCGIGASAFLVAILAFRKRRPLSHDLFNEMPDPDCIIINPKNPSFTF